MYKVNEERFSEFLEYEKKDGNFQKIQSNIGNSIHDFLEHLKWPFTTERIDDLKKCENIEGFTRVLEWAELERFNEERKEKEKKRLVKFENILVDKNQLEKLKEINQEEIKIKKKGDLKIS